VRQAWLGLAIASLNLANLEAAAAALARALSRHVGTPDGDLVAEAIAGATGAPGWCAMPRYGRIGVALRGAPRSLATALDGIPFQLVGKRGRAELRLPPDWIAARRLTIRADGRDLLGSPLDLAAIRRTEGCVECHAGGLSGWAWHPAEPGADPVLQVQPVGRRQGSIQLRATDLDIALPTPVVLAR